MKNIIKSWIGGICLTAAVLLIPTGAGAAAGQKDLAVSAEAACVMDLQSGTVLYDKNMNKKEYPASITKIMTTLVAMDNSSLSETVKYDDRAYTNWESRASNIGIVDGEKLSMEDSLYAIMLASANEVCNGVAIHVAGSIENYVAKMNEKAKELGCKNTHFMNPNGLWNKDHYTSPYDMALIGRAAMQNENFRTIASTKYYDIGKSNKRKYIDPMGNHHKMLNPGNMPQYGYKYCIGGKTGYTDKCRYTLVTFAKKGNIRAVMIEGAFSGRVETPHAHPFPQGVLFRQGFNKGLFPQFHQFTQLVRLLRPCPVHPPVQRPQLLLPLIQPGQENLSIRVPFPVFFPVAFHRAADGGRIIISRQFLQPEEADFFQNGFLMLHQAVPGRNGSHPLRRNGKDFRQRGPGFLPVRPCLEHGSQQRHRIPAVIRGRRIGKGRYMLRRPRP